MFCLLSLYHLTLGQELLTKQVRAPSWPCIQGFSGPNPGRSSNVSDNLIRSFHRYSYSFKNTTVVDS